MGGHTTVTSRGSTTQTCAQMCGGEGEGEGRTHRLREAVTSMPLTRSVILERIAPKIAEPMAITQSCSRRRGREGERKRG